ncbi:lysophospholipid acyltransferase family protein [Antarcticirhabdus aurantiaca]|uniref:Lysophospholipid acyltransferase family protein n=1 Tax=Antarcticirhabdus aurantiaca TaxID=2606717 RepID=A0ACD4NSX7_9HYPH|nr:lysophospholipid acyltransferase family protein [Antarcticirhabdus aurantiaca]WAJ29863.1 lysophospholipid acyltransferase family protein [Jeongeuplla avenae]
MIGTKLRSVAFNTLFYANLFAQLLFWSPVFFLVPEAVAWRIVKNWARSSLWLLQVIVGARSHVAGTERIPHGAAIIAAKHQSFWDVLALLPVIDRPTFILKKELMRVPIFGWFARRMRMIPVDRKKRGGAIASMLEGAHRAIADGRQIVIFPEGTRTRPGAEADYRPGVFRLYEALGVPAVPVAVNAGLYWPSGTYLRQPGVVRAEVLEPIPPGLDRAAFLDRLRRTIEAHCLGLLRRAYDERPELPMNEAVRAKLRVRQAAED